MTDSIKGEGKIEEKNPKKAEVQEELLDAGSNITTLEDLLQQLENKLDPILSQSRPKEEKTKENEERESEIGKSLQEVNSRISILISQVMDINERVEV